MQFPVKGWFFRIAREFKVIVIVADESFVFALLLMKSFKTSVPTIGEVELGLRYAINVPKDWSKVWLSTSEAGESITGQPCVERNSRQVGDVFC